MPKHCSATRYVKAWNVRYDIDLSCFLLADLGGYADWRHLEKKITPRSALGKPDPLFKLRDVYNSSIVIRPWHNVSHHIGLEEATWDSGMKTYMYIFKEGVKALHIFTGNKEELQGVANEFLEDIQRHVMLSREGASGKYSLSLALLFGELICTTGGLYRSIFYVCN